jgi:hypothetical protein
MKVVVTEVLNNDQEREIAIWSNVPDLNASVQLSFTQLATADTHKVVTYRIYILKGWRGE